MKHLVTLLSWLVPTVLVTYACGNDAGPSNGEEALGPDAGAPGASGADSSGGSNSATAGNAGAPGAGGEASELIDSGTTSGGASSSTDAGLDPDLTGGAGGTGGATSEAGGGSGGGGPLQPPACTDDQRPSVDDCAPDESYAVFVSPAGTAGAAGTRAAPLNTLAAGLTRAAELGLSHLLVCHGTYPEVLRIDDGEDGFTISGGFDCTTWQYAPGQGSSSVEPGTFDPALIVTSAQSLLIEDLAFQARDAQNPGTSSIAGVVSGSDEVTLLRVSLSAGNGANAAAPPAFTPAALPVCTNLDCVELEGIPGGPTLGGGAKVAQCPHGVASSGANGGAGGPTPGPGSNGMPALGAGLGGSGTDCSLAGAGMNGAPGAEGAHGAVASAIGAVSGLQWQASAGGSGLNGGTGQGGGGGAGSPTGGGGGGGAGGCGGAGAPGGLGGGASIALLSVNSGLALPDSVLLSADGGAGSNGVPGQLGNSRGGFGAAAGPGACQGGQGGRGGNGGNGAGGTGGSSLGVVFIGAAPDVTEAQFEQGSPGAPGAAGGAGAPAGLPGLAANALVSG